MSMFEVLIMLCLYVEYMSNVTCSGLVLKTRSHCAFISECDFVRLFTWCDCHCDCDFYRYMYVYLESHIAITQNRDGTH